MEYLVVLFVQTLPLADFGASYREYLGEFSDDIALSTLLLEA